MKRLRFHVPCKRRLGMNCRLYLRLFLFVLPALNVFPAMLFCTLAFYIFFYFLKGGSSSRSNKVAAAPERGITPEIFSDMFRVSLSDLSCYLCLQCADEPGRCHIRRHGYQQVHMVSGCFSGQHLPAETVTMKSPISSVITGRRYFVTKTIWYVSR